MLKFFYIISLAFLLKFSDSPITQMHKSRLICDCDTTETKAIIFASQFNRIPDYDTIAFANNDLYKLDPSINRLLWYRDIENIDTTKFTKLWNAYVSGNYHASHLDFVNYYKGKQDIRFAFQLGPSGPLWAYHTFVIKKVGCCYLATRSYFAHARFTYKAYSIISETEIDSLSKALEKVNTYSTDKKPEFRNCGYFVDNRNNISFFIDFEKETVQNKIDSTEFELKSEIKELINIIDQKIKWRTTYEL